MGENITLKDMTMPDPITDLDIRKKRALFRAQHRGMKEMDILLGRYAEAKLALMDNTILTKFEAFLEIYDRELEGWIMRDGLVAAEDDFAALVADIRAFHGIG